MNTELSVTLFVLVHVVTLVPCQFASDGQIRLTGWTEKNGGRLEVFLNGKWGTVSGQTDPHDNDLHLGFGKTVCYQINHYNGDDSSVFTGTVSSLNKYLQKMPGNAFIKPNTSLNQVIYGLNCTNKEDHSPRHILRCSYKISYGGIDRGEDLAVLCPHNASNYNNAYPGQFLLKPFDLNSNAFVIDEFDPSHGHVFVYAGSRWLPMSFINGTFNGTETICKQLGYTNDQGMSYFNHIFTLFPYVKAPSMSCNSHDVCLQQCLSKGDADKLYSDNATLLNGHPWTVGVKCIFDTFNIDSASPIIGDDCLPYMSSHGAGIDIVAITVSIAIVTGIAVAITTVIICFFNKKCFIYQQRKRLTYAEI